MSQLFGTDGVRGLANRKLTAQLALEMGDAAVRVLAKDCGEGRRRVVVGRDTRVSGDFLAAALESGMAAGGFDIIDAGIIPTPGVAFLASVLNVEIGAVISASHNPMPDNGIKFFAQGGFKLPDSKEDEIEKCLGTEWERPTGAAVGRISHDEKTPSNIYIDHLVSAIDPADSHTSAASGSAADNSDSHVIFDGGSDGGSAGDSGSISDSQANSGQAGSGQSGSEQSSSKPLAGLRIVIDCANGAASYVAPEAFRRAGAEVSVINAYPDGYNINKEAGSTHPERLQAMVRASDADMGVAFDGDADRCIAVDEDGKLVNGDKIMGILARSYKEQGLLENDTLVVTVMSNLGLKLALRDMGIKTVETAVGDRYVLEEMLRGGYTLGGEQSGHVINRRFSTTGDGTLTALCLANEVMRSGKSLKQLAADFPQLPQTLINVPNVDKAASKTNKAVLEAVEREEHSLGGAGRVLLRPSGTEPLVRVMVEAATQEQSDEVARRLADTVATELKLN